MKQEPQNVEAALSHVIKFEAFEQLLTSQDAMVDHNDDCAMSWLCSVCTFAGLSEVGETAALHKLIRDLQDALAQTTRVMAAMANRLSSGHTTPFETASSVDSILDALLMPVVLAPGHTALGQPGLEGGRGRAAHQHGRETDSCHICGQVRQQTDESDQQTEPANGTATCRHVI